MFLFVFINLFSFIRFIIILIFVSVLSFAVSVGVIRLQIHGSWILSHCYCPFSSLIYYNYYHDRDLHM